MSLDLQGSISWITGNDPYHYHDEDEFCSRLKQQIRYTSRISQDEFYGKDYVIKEYNNLFHFAEYGCYFWESWNGYSMDIFWRPVKLDPLFS
ncbi:hypothetical protein NVP2275O_233 [Vibrio phage 2.275.O._10N.286.54.E11]|nr:hypothetical protein NVP2275O_233 [Vibrio phage 2.275.O._10N.286.54.E11]